MADLNITDKEKKLLAKIAVLIAIAYGAVWGSEFYTAKFTQEGAFEHDTWNEELSDYRLRLSAINEEEKAQSQFVEAYNSYKERNLIVGPKVVENQELLNDLNEEQRLFLLERLRKVQNERKFFSADYSLASPENLPATFSDLTQGSDVAVRANKMTVQMPLLHSLDLLMLLNDFYDLETNNFNTVRCAMSFSGAERNDDDDQSALLELRENIEASCDLVWLSVYDPQYGATIDASGSAEVVTN